MALVFKVVTILAGVGPCRNAEGFGNRWDWMLFPYILLLFWDALLVTDPSYVRTLIIRARLMKQPVDVRFNDSTVGISSTG